MFKKMLPTITLALVLLTGCRQQPPLETNPPIEPPASNNSSQDTNQSAGDYTDTFLLKIGAAITEDVPFKDAESIAVLVNKQNELAPDYVPPDLVEVNVAFTFNEKAEKRMMRKEAAEKLEELFNAAKKENIILYGVSGYRSYQTQKDLFSSFTQRYGSEEKANQISARPGQSEHQTGLAMDVSSQSVNYGLEEEFGNTKEYAWLKENAHHYGYVVRYPKGKEYMTEYTYEPWHLRYVGKELATKLYEEKITYEEYLFFRI